MCRGFLDVARCAMGRVVELVFNDPGMSGLLKALFSSAEWLEGRTTTTLIATLQDYMNDLEVCVLYQE